jgi:acyl dehydratase
MLTVRGRDELLSSSPRELGASRWIAVEQSRIEGFADVTDDHAWIHVDIERARREMPGGRTIAHGFLSLSLLPKLLDDLIRVEGVDKGYNYGLEGLRFLAPVPSGARIRLVGTLESTEARGARDVRVVYDCRLEIEGAERPAIVAKWLALYVF